MSDDHRLNDLVSLWQRHRSEGRDVPAAELCAGQADLIPALERRIGLLRQMDRLVGAANAKTRSLVEAGGQERAPPASTLPLAGAPDTAETRALSGAPAGYEILCELGRGGMAVVYKAHQAQLDRVTAVKMILSGASASPVELALLRAEARAIARFTHPNIVQIYEVGEHHGLPFLALEYCAGDSLDRKLRGGPLPAREAAALVEVIARAVQAAHDKGIVHRDLKPSNVLLTEDGTPKISDFGLAKRLDAGGDGGALMGTPPYMAPEQVTAAAGDVGPVTDVYALGAVLYECLTGRPPFRAPTVSETLRQVLGTEPVAPRLLQPPVPKDLEVICLKCLRKDRARRYASARDLADDLRRFLEGRPILARPAGPAERARRWCRRNPALAGLLAAVAVSLVAGTSVAVVLAALARGEAQRAVAARRQAEWLLYASEIAHYQREWDGNNLPDAWQHLDATPPGLRGWEYRYLRALFGANHQTFRGGAGRVNAVHFAAGGRRVAAAGGDPLVPDKPGEVCVWDARTGRAVFSRGGLDGQALGVCFSPDGRRLASAGRDGALRLFDAATGDEVLVREVPGKRQVNAVCFSPDGRRLATAGDDRAVLVWDTRGPQPLLTFRGHEGRDGPDGHDGVVTAVCFAPDGRHLVSGSDDRTVRVWDTGRPSDPPMVLQGHTACVSSVCFSPDGACLASASGDSLDPTRPGELRLWDARTGQALAFKGLPGPVWGVCFSPDGRRLASAGDDGTVRVWDVEGARDQRELRERLVLKGHWGGVTAVSFAGDGTRLASGGADGTVRVWETDRPQGPLACCGHTDVVFAACFGPDGRLLASTGADDTVRVWDAATGQEALHLEGDPRDVFDVRFSPDGRLLAGGSQFDTVKLWDAATGKALPPLKGPDRAGPGGDRLNADLAEQTRTVTSVAFSPDGARLAGGSAAGGVLVWDTRAGRVLFAVAGHAGGVKHVGFSPDGTRLASGGDDRTVRVWDVATGRQLLALNGHTGPVTAVGYAPDGRRLASGGDDRTVRLWDADTGEALLTPLTVGDAAVSGLAFSPDGERLVAVAGRALRVWVAATGLPLLTLRAPEGALTGVCFSPDGSRLATPSRDRKVWVWNAPAASPAPAGK